MSLTPSHILTGGICLGVGVGIGYLSAHKAAEIKFRRLANEEVESVKKMYRLLRKEGDIPFAPTKDDLAEYNERLDGLDYGWAQQAAELEAAERRESEAIMQANELASSSETSDETVDEPAPTTGSLSVVEAIVETALGKEEKMNLFDRKQPTPDETGKPLNENAPHVITVEDYMIDEPDYEKYTITYYDGDGVLADERDEVIHDIDGVIGSQNLTEFQGSTVVYIRNPRLESDYEVLLSAGEYRVEVQGFDPNEPASG